MRLVREFIKKNISEINSNRSLKWYGFALGLSHLSTFLLWSRNEYRMMNLFHGTERICWPFLPNCEAYSVSFPVIYFILTAYFCAAVASSFFFIRERVTPAYFLLLLATGLKAFVYLNDYRFMGNFHYMHYWALVAFLFIPDKIRTLQFLIVFFYVAASLLKFNLEWLSGAAMVRETFLQGKWLEWACYYVVLLESFFVWGLLSRKPRLFGLTFGQIVLFHLYSFLVVGFYYPSIMACLLSILVLSRHYKELPSSFRGLSHVSIIFLAVFAILHALPRVLSDRPDLDGRGRLTALNMLDAKPQCETFFVAKFKNEVRELPRLAGPLTIRIQCDPIVVLKEAQWHCQKLKGQPDFMDMDVALVSRRFTDESYRPIFEFRNLCENPRSISVLGIIE